MFCNKCGAELKDNDKFCNKCGTPVDANQSETEFKNQATLDNKSQSANNSSSNFSNDIISSYAFTSFVLAAKLLVIVIITSFISTLITFWPDFARCIMSTIRNWWYYFPLILLLIVFSKTRSKNPALAIGVICIIVKQFMLFINAIRVGAISSIIGVSFPQLLAWMLVLSLVLVNTIEPLKKYTSVLNKLYFLPALLYFVAIIVFMLTGGKNLFSIAVNPFNIAQLLWLVLNILYWIAEAIAVFLISKCLVK